MWEKAYNFLLINAVFYIPLLFVNIVRLSIQGMGFTQMAVIAGFCEMVARIFVAVFFVPTLGFTAAAFASPVAWFAADAFLFPCYFKVMKQMRQRMGQAA